MHRSEHWPYEHLYYVHTINLSIYGKECACVGFNAETEKHIKNEFAYFSILRISYILDL